MNAGLGSAQFHSHLLLTGRKEHDYASNESLPWPSYRRAVDLILLGHAKRHLPEWGKILIGPRFSAARVPRHWVTFIARTICLELTQAGDECLRTGKWRGCLWQKIDCDGDILGMFQSSRHLARVTRSDPAATIFRPRWLHNLTPAVSVDSSWGNRR